MVAAQQLIQAHINALDFLLLGTGDNQAGKGFPPPTEDDLFYIPVETKSTTDKNTLVEAQQYLLSFGLDRDRLSIARFIQATPVFNSQLSGKIYPVVRPLEYAAIYQSWEAIIPIRDNIPTRRFRRTPTLGDALVVFLYDGNEQAIASDGIIVPPPASSLSPTKPAMRARPRTAPIVDEVSGLFASTSISPRPPSRPVRHDDQAPPQRTRTTTPRTPSHVPTNYAPPTASSSHADQNPQVHANARVFRHIRDLTGVVGSEDVPSRRTCNPNLNAAANEYLWTHGYQGGSIQLIQQVYEESDDVTSFVERVANSGGISVAEARYIYSLIDGSANRA